MNATILHFSGTGNSRLLARSVEARIPGSLAAPLSQASRAEKGYMDSGLIGIAYPVHFLQAPRIVKAYVKALDFTGKRVFLLASSGGAVGDALGQVADIVHENGGKVSATLHLPMADNSVALRTPCEEQRLRFAAIPGKLDELVASLDTGYGTEHLSRRRANWYRLYGGTIRLGMDIAYGWRSRKVDRERCNGCGACSRACPAGNVSLESGKAAIGDRCGECFGCLHACPVFAIRFGRLRIDAATRYTAPAGPL